MQNDSIVDRNGKKGCITISTDDFLGIGGCRKEFDSGGENIMRLLGCIASLHAESNINIDITSLLADGQETSIIAKWFD